MIEFILIYVFLGLVIDISSSVFAHIKGGEVTVLSTLVTVFLWPFVIYLAYKEIKEEEKDD